MSSAIARSISSFQPFCQADEAWTQLATRIPKDLHRRIKLHCVTHDIVLLRFVVEAIEEKLGRKPRPKKGTV